MFYTYFTSSYCISLPLPALKIIAYSNTWWSMSGEINFPLKFSAMQHDVNLSDYSNHFFLPEGIT